MAQSEHSATPCSSGESEQLKTLISTIRSYVSPDAPGAVEGADGESALRACDSLQKLFESLIERNEKQQNFSECYDRRSLGSSPPSEWDEARLPIGRHKTPVPQRRESPMQLQSNPLAAGPTMIRLLVVEDDEFQQHAIEDLCVDCGYNTRCASDADEALEMVRCNPDINLVLSDVMMEGASGYDLLVRIRALRSSVAVIMISAYESIDLVEQCILSGADAYLLKPLRMHEMRNIWQYAWRRRLEVVMQKQVNDIVTGPNVHSGRKMKGARQRLKKKGYDDVHDILDKSDRELDKLETVSNKAMEKSVREQLQQLILEEPHSAPLKSSHIDSDDPGLPPVQEVEDPDYSTSQEESPCVTRSPRMAHVQTSKEQRTSTSEEAVTVQTSPSDDGATTICRLCEGTIPVKDLTYHLVCCTAIHSCYEKMRQTDSALKHFASSVRVRRKNMVDNLRAIEDSLAPLDTLAQYSDSAASVANDESMVVTYELMEIQRSAEDKLSKLKDPHLIELSAQVRRLVTKKMDILWDMLSMRELPATRIRAKNSKTSSFRKGRSIREFALVEPLGSGGFGTVWLAKRRRTGDLVAVKVLDKERPHMRLADARTEKTILACADCPYVVNLLFSFSTPKHWYLVMEFLPGGDCFSLLQNFGFLEEPVTVQICAETLLGLEYLHDMMVAHRDLKPQNMLISAEGHIKLADFGLSSEGPEPQPMNDGAAPSKDAPMYKSAVGTTDYLAPEIIHNAGYSFSVDFWALGVCLYQFLLGETPFNASTAEAVFRRIVTCDLHLPGPEDISPQASELITKLLVVDPTQRLGAGGLHEIKMADFFQHIDLSQELWKLPSLYKPDLSHPLDTSNFKLNAQAKDELAMMRSQLEDDHAEDDDSGDELRDVSDVDSFRLVNATQLARMQLAAATAQNFPQKIEPVEPIGSSADLEKPVPARLDRKSLPSKEQDVATHAPAAPDGVRHASKPELNFRSKSC